MYVCVSVCVCADTLSPHTHTYMYILEEGVSTHMHILQEGMSTSNVNLLYKRVCVYTRVQTKVRVSTHMYTPEEGVYKYPHILRERVGLLTIGACLHISTL